MYYPLFDVFFDVVSIESYWVPAGDTFCRGSIRLKPKPISTLTEEVEVFFYLKEDKEEIDNLSSNFKNNLCKWCGINPYELHYIIEQEWKRRKPTVNENV
tara:strand:- start:6614 stop:6913 length:300 start_codon:yes stop_codon:yes gene_type:complete